ncbi:hypothetical protein MAM1_0032d02428 [Mucor ambiguus]|uniref:Uncharacterized protein n=1 Tax=Mucor ambiguus TaxID=91626 RepID=A0A0C9MM38_9FUNG|nr:hypothetical protein MAM1_0032d02428 [Mucor ambiguus]
MLRVDQTYSRNCLMKRVVMNHYLRMVIQIIHTRHASQALNLFLLFWDRQRVQVLTCFHQAFKKRLHFTSYNDCLHAEFKYVKVSFDSNGVDDPSRQPLTDNIANRSDDLGSDVQSSTNVSFKDENEGDAVDGKADDDGTAHAVEAKVSVNAMPNKRLLLQMMLSYL